MDICFAKSLRKEVIDVLDFLVNQHHNLYLKLFNDTLKLKHHNMKHFSLVIKMSSLLSQLCLLRFESKRQELKAIAMSTTSRSNICHTISHRRLSKVGLSCKFEFGDGERLDSVSSSEKFHFLQTPVPKTFSGPCLDVPGVNISEVKYKICSFVVLEVIPDGFLEFGKILNVFVSEEQQVCFLCQKMIVMSFCEGMHTYEVYGSSEMTRCIAENLITLYVAIHHCLGDGREIISVVWNLRSFSFSNNACN